MTVQSRIANFAANGLALRLLELVLVLAAATLATWWALRILAGPPLPVAASLPAGSTVTEIAPQALLDSVALFGARRPGAVSDNIVALGMIADGRGRGHALLSIDGQPAKRYRVGDELDGRRITAIRKGEIEYALDGEKRTVKVVMPEVPSAGVVRHAARPLPPAGRPGAP